jgi:pimeloyl-ACP methyl ester carboxylesterase
VPDPKQAVGLWEMRRLILEAMNTPLNGHGALITAYERDIKSRPDMDEVAQMVDFLPPFEPAKDIRPMVQKLSNSKRGGTDYLIKLPPEYTHNRSYPVVIALHDKNETALTVVKRWEKMAARHGYILVVPELKQIEKGIYRYTEEEHQEVVNTLRDVRRRFHPDCDRVFLFGQGEGGKMAFDVGLSHPDLFAGVMPMSAGPLFYARKYWRNAQHLPFYVMLGTNVIREYGVGMREQLKSWIDNRYSILLVEYKGRGSEWLGGELPNMFDWMRFQKRVFPLNRLGSDGLGGGFGEEFCTHRETDDRFYWITTDGLSKACKMPERRWNNLIQPAKISARVVPATNTIISKGVGVNQMTIWIGRDSAGRYLLDLDQKVTIRAGVREWSGMLKPSLEVLLEDLHTRGDRKHLFVAKKTFSGRLGG